MKKKPDTAALAAAFAKFVAAQEQEPANDDAIDEEALRELAQRDAEEMKKARRR